MTLIILASIAVGLFLSAFITKRRFGVLGLGLSAGVVLSQYGGAILAQQLRSLPLGFSVDSYQSLATIILIVLPVIFLLVGGPVYSSRRSSVISSVGFVVLAMTLIIGPFSALVPADDHLSREAIVMVMNRQSTIIVVGVVLALIDIFMIHGAAARHLKSSKH